MAEEMNDAVAEVSDEQFEKYFETQGEIDLETTEEETAEEETAEEETAEEETAEEETAEEEPKEEETAEEEPAWQKAAFKEERELRKEAEARAQRMEETFRKVMEKMQPPEPKVPEAPKLPEQPPVYEEDPEGYRRWLEAKLAETNQKVQTVESTTSQTQQAQQLQQAAVASEQAFIAQGHADYPQALQHVANVRLADYQAMGYTPEQANQVVTNEFWFLVQNHLSQNKNPAETIYKWAERNGYKKADDKSTSSTPTIDKLEKGVKQSKSVATMGGGGAPEDTELTLNKLSDMSDTEFDKYWAQFEQEAKKSK